jgi:hypothetical protein
MSTQQPVGEGEREMRAGAADEDGGWTGAVAGWLGRRLPLHRLLPTRQPYFIGSWVYVFGVVTIAALVASAPSSTPSTSGRCTACT